MTIWKFCKSDTCILDNENRCMKYIVYIILLLHLFVFIDKFTVKAKMYIRRRKFRNQQNMVGVVNTICSCPGVSCALYLKSQEAEDHIRQLLAISIHFNINRNIIFQFFYRFHFNLDVCSFTVNLNVFCYKNQAQLYDSRKSVWWRSVFD